MHPGDNPELAARFLDWLRARGDFRESTPLDVERLNDLGAWTLPSADVARPEMPEAERNRLLELHVAWRSFCDQQDADWIGRSDAGDAGVTWIDSQGSQDRAPPPGSAPSLVPAGVRPRAVAESSPLRGVGSALVMPLVLVVAGLLLVFAESASETSLATTIRGARQQLARGRDESLARIARQRALGGILTSLRRQQRDVVNSRCEAGPWCDDRIDARTRSLRLAEQFARNAELWSVPDGVLPDTTAAVMLPLDLEILLSERRSLAAGRSIDPGEQPAPSPAEIARRLGIVDAEIDLVRRVQP